MRRRFGVDVVLAVVLPAVCAVALFLVRPDVEQPTGGVPVETPLSTASVVCPAALEGGDELGLTSLADPDGGLEGPLSVGLGGAATEVPVRSGRVERVPSDGAPVVVSGSGELAPGLVAGRARPAPLAAADCAPPVADQWFTAAGADATHDSVLQLTNPNAGPAVADVTVRGPSGLLDVPALRGVTVPGGSTTSLDLGQVLPRRGELSLEVHTSRGRLAVHVVDVYDELGGGVRTQDWLPAQAAPERRAVLLGLTGGAGERTLVLANPGPDEVRAELQVITADATFAPTGVEPVRVAPDSTEAVSLDDVLGQAAADGATGVLVEATGAVTATLRQVVDGDLSLLTDAPVLDAPAAAVLPTGAKRLLLGDPGGSGTATVTAYAANGKQLAQTPVELAAGAGADVELPEKTALVTLDAQGASVRAAVLLSGTGTAVVPLRELVLTGLVPDVRPGVP